MFIVLLSVAGCATTPITDRLKAQVQAMFSEAIAALGSLDILVNNAGIQKDSTFLDMSWEGRLRR